MLGLHVEACIWMHMDAMGFLLLLPGLIFPKTNFGDYMLSHEISPPLSFPPTTQWLGLGLGLGLGLALMLH